MAVAMRDPNLVHMEDEYAKKSGLPRVIAHGTFAVAYVGSALSQAVGIGRVRRVKVELTAPVFPQDIISVAYTDIQTNGDITTARISANNQSGTLVARGEATWLTNPSR
jgi:acyl dehydratase